MLFVGTDANRLRNEIRVIETETGERVDFAIVIDYTPESLNVTYGRARWLPDDRAIAFVGLDEQGRVGVFAQDFVPGVDTTDTRRELTPFREDRPIESLGLSVDGNLVVYSVVREVRALQLAEGLPKLR